MLSNERRKAVNNATLVKNNFGKQTKLKSETKIPQVN